MTDLIFVQKLGLLKNKTAHRPKSKEFQQAAKIYQQKILPFSQLKTPKVKPLKQNQRTNSISQVKKTTRNPMFRKSSMPRPSVPTSVNNKGYNDLKSFVLSHSSILSEEDVDGMLKKHKKKPNRPISASFHTSTVDSMRETSPKRSH